jgi:hypothetical protein
MAVDGSLKFDTKIDTEGFEKGTNTIKTQADSIKGKLVSMGKALITAFAVTKIVEFGKKAIDLASDLQEVQNVVDTTFGDGANSINSFAENAIEQFGLSELSAKQFTSTIGAMFKSMGLSSEATLEMSQGITGLAGDMASFYNLDPTEAFNKLRAGIAGETEPLKQLGINMSVANLEAYALAQGIDTSYASMTQAEQAALRYGYLMQATADAQGDFAKTSDSYANQTKVLEERWNQLSATLGTIFLPVATLVSGAINEFVTGLMEAVNWAKEHETTVTVLGVAVGTLAAAILAYNIVQNASAIATTIATAAMTAFGAVMAFITSPITLVVLAIGALIAIGVLLYKNWDTIKEYAGTVWDKIKEVFQGFSNFIKGVFEKDFSKSFGVLGDVINTYKDAIISVWDNIKKIFNGIITFVKGVFTGDWKKAWEGVKDIFSGIFGTFVTIVKTPLNAVIDIINGLIKGIVAGINAVIGAVNSINFTLPDWVPGIGGKDIGFNLKEFTAPKIPKLATGTVVPANYGNFLAILGDNKREPEIVSPVSKIEEAVENVLRRRGGMGDGGEYTFIAQIDGRTIFKETIKQEQMHRKLTGKSAFNY